MGGTTRFPAWWAPNAPDLHATNGGPVRGPAPCGRTPVRPLRSIAQVAVAS